MPSESFARRAQLTELMDQPSSYEELRACLRDLERVNRTVLSYRPTLGWLRQFAVPRAVPLHIVDVGSGGGDMLRRIEHWARQHRFDVYLTGIDLNPHATRAAREFSIPSSRIQWVTADAHTWHPSRPVDIVLSSLFTHHLADDEIVRFLAWMEQSARVGWFINDLSRGRLSYHGFKLLARLKRWHRFVQHDGPVSVQRSFRSEDWRRFIAGAGLDPGAVHVRSAWPGRLCVARVKA